VICRQLEQGLHHRLVGALPQDVGGHPPAEHEVERVHQDGLSGTGLAGEDVQPRAELDLDRIDDREAGDAQGREHGAMIHGPLTLRKFSGIRPFG